ncbi:MAG: hypothetical protein MPW15_20515 [Candidatus Manganitrophus sp.]|nr:hypothetical protein [Candidatus Manganitrophus sp.]
MSFCFSGEEEAIRGTGDMGNGFGGVIIGSGGLTKLNSSDLRGAFISTSFSACKPYQPKDMWRNKENNNAASTKEIFFSDALSGNFEKLFP